MATTYTPLLELPKHDPTGPFDITKINDGFDLIDAGMAKAYQGKAVHNLLDNSDFLHPANQRSATANTKSGEYLHDRWKSEAGNNAAGVVQITDAGVTLAPTSSNYCGISQMLDCYAELEGETVTLSVCVGGAWDAVSFTLGSTPAGGAVTSNGLRIYSASGYHVLIRNPAGNSSITIQRVALYEGAYTADTLPEYQPKGYAVELMECQRYYHLYATMDARPAHGMDCSPPMRINAPTQGAITIDGAVYYYNAADL